MKNVGKVITLIAVFGATHGCLAEQIMIQCFHEKNWCSDSVSALTSQADLRPCEPTDLPILAITYDEANKTVQFKRGSFFLGSSSGEITQIEDLGYQRLIHFRTDYYRGMSSIAIAGDDTSVLLGHATNLMTADGFSYFSLGHRGSCGQKVTR